MQFAQQLAVHLKRYPVICLKLRTSKKDAAFNTLLKTGSEWKRAALAYNCYECCPLQYTSSAHIVRQEGDLGIIWFTRIISLARNNFFIFVPIPSIQ